MLDTKKEREGGYVWKDRGVQIWRTRSYHPLIHYKLGTCISRLRSIVLVCCQKNQLHSVSGLIRWSILQSPAPWFRKKRCKWQGAQTTSTKQLQKGSFDVKKILVREEKWRKVRHNTPISQGLFEWFKGKFRDISVSMRQVFWSKGSTLLLYKREGMIEEAKQRIEKQVSKQQKKM